jgi:hypothetical protein
MRLVGNGKDDEDNLELNLELNRQEKHDKEDQVQRYKMKVSRSTWNDRETTKENLGLKGTEEDNMRKSQNGLLMWVTTKDEEERSLRPEGDRRVDKKGFSLKLLLCNSQNSCFPRFLTLSSQ